MLFYEEFEEGKNGQPDGNCIVVFPENGVNWSNPKIPTYEGLAAVYFYPNSPVALTGISIEYLRTKCKRCSKKCAFAIHPELAKRVQQME